MTPQPIPTGLTERCRFLFFNMYYYYYYIVSCQLSFHDGSAHVSTIYSRSAIFTQQRHISVPGFERLEPTNVAGEDQALHSVENPLEKERKKKGERTNEEGKRRSHGTELFKAVTRDDYV